MFNEAVNRGLSAFEPWISLIYIVELMEMNAKLIKKWTPYGFENPLTGIEEKIE